MEIHLTVTVFMFAEQAFDEDTNKFLMEWEKKNAEAYLDEKAQKDKESVPVRVKGVSER